MPAQRSVLARRGRHRQFVRKNLARSAIARPGGSGVPRKPGCRESPQQKGDALMEIHELDQLGDEIAELSAHLEAATARLLALIREFDARGGWNSGFRSCAASLSWRA